MFKFPYISRLETGVSFAASFYTPLAAPVASKVIDTYEKALADIDLWLCQQLLSVSI